LTPSAEAQLAKANNIMVRHVVVTRLRNQRAFSALRDIGVEQPPTKFTQYVTGMKETCPQEMKAYAACVLAAQESGTSLHHACDAEFRKVKDCFRAVRKG
jgi:hypothetical protein